MKKFYCISTYYGKIYFDVVKARSKSAAYEEMDRNEGVCIILNMKEAKKLSSLLISNHKAIVATKLS